MPIIKYKICIQFEKLKINKKRDECTIMLIIFLAIILIIYLFMNFNQLFNFFPYFVF
jgi:hypothetical protein